MNDTKPGWKTTEFWLSTGAAIFSLLWGAGVMSVVINRVGGGQSFYPLPTPPQNGYQLWAT